MSIIGKLYIPIDNSYSVCISKEDNCHGVDKWSHDYLAGTQGGREAKVCRIITEPFLMRMKKSWKESKSFVLVEYNDNIYTVLYFEEGLLIKERVLAIDKQYHSKQTSPIVKQLIDLLIED